MNRLGFESPLLQSRRLLPKEAHKRNTTNEIVKSPSDETNRGSREKNVHSFSIGTNNEEYMDKIRQKMGSNKQPVDVYIIQKRCLKDQTTKPRVRRAFDTEPFYNGEVKPHITTQKRVRYKHLEDESLTEKKRTMPKEILDGPRIYERDGQREGKKYEKVPISLNPILREASLHDKS